MTLVEVLVSTVILALIAGALSAAFVTALNLSRPTSQRLKESNDAQLTAAFLVRDAQAAGGSDPFTGVVDDATLGVSTSDATIDGLTCTSTANLVLSFKWIDQTTVPGTKHVAAYKFDASNHRLTRTVCSGTTALGTANSLVLGKFVSSVTNVVCKTGGASAPCTGMPDSVSMTLQETNSPLTGPSAYKYTLTASLRPQSQTTPSGTNSLNVSLLLLGGNGGCTASSPPLDATGGSGASQIDVYGTAYVNGGNTSCVAADLNGNYTASGGTEVVAGTHCASSPTCTNYPTAFVDPYAGLTPPPGNCTTGLPAPAAHSGSTYFPGVYTGDTIPSNAILSPGIYIFCHGFSPSGVNVTSPGVLLYLAGLCSASQPQPCVTSNLGTLNASGTNYFQPATSGAYKGLVMWQAVSNNVSPTFGTANGSATNLDGTVYVPGAILTVKKSTQMKAVVALGIRWGSGGGNGTTIIGTALPITINTPNMLPNGTAQQLYASTQVTASGGGGTFTWSAQGLPNGLNIDANTGVISGSPTATGSFTIKVTATDVFGTTGTKTFAPITIHPALTITGSLPPFWTVGHAYPATTLVASGGTGGYTWSASGLPSNLSISGSGVVSGTPNQAQTTTPTIRLTDSFGDVTTLSATVTISPPPTLVSVQLKKVGGTAGKIEKGDQIIVTFATQMKESSICSTWGPDDTAPQSLSANGDVVTVTDGTGAINDSITVAATSCTFNFGSINLGSNAYVTGGSATFGTNGGSNRSTYAWDANAHTLTITLGTKAGAGTIGTVASSSPSYTISNLITDPAGVTVSPATILITTGPQF